MTLTEAITVRHSVRTFKPEAVIDEAIIDELRAHIPDHIAASPFGGHVELCIHHFDLDGAFKPSTYGVISGASWYVMMGIADDMPSRLTAGFAMERLLLEATTLGLSSCWIAATFKSTVFERGADFPKECPLRIVSPLGYASERRRFIESLTRLAARSSSRKPFDKLFEAVDTDASSVSSDIIYALEMLRRAPSSVNSQPWRAVYSPYQIDFYNSRNSALSEIDMGIALCHFDLAMSQTSLSGDWSVKSVTPSKSPSMIASYMIRQS